MVFWLWWLWLCGAWTQAVRTVKVTVMGIMMPETCWDKSLIINIRLVASCWFLSLQPTFMMHGHTSLKLDKDELARCSWIRYRHGASMNAVQTFIVTYFTPMPCFMPYLRSWKIGRKSRRRVLLSSWCVDCNNYGKKTPSSTSAVYCICYCGNVFRPNCVFFRAII